jgi:hypothetical protein
VMPWGPSFLRFGAEATPVAKGGDVRFLWGFGFESWRDRTFFAHVHDWGPVRPAEGLGVEGAELSVGYKLPRICLGGGCVAPTAFANVPRAGGPYVGGRLTLTLPRGWYAMGGLGWTVPGVHEGPLGTPEWRVVYGFGRLDWRPGSIFLTYHDWGPSYRDGNGIVAVGVNWAF